MTAAERYFKYFASTGLSPSPDASASRHHFSYSGGYSPAVSSRGVEVNGFSSAAAGPQCTTEEPSREKLRADLSQRVRIMQDDRRTVGARVSARARAMESALLRSLDAESKGFAQTSDAKAPQMSRMCSGSGSLCMSPFGAKSNGSTSADVTSSYSSSDDADSSRESSDDASSVVSSDSEEEWESRQFPVELRGFRGDDERHCRPCRSAPGGGRAASVIGEWRQCIACDHKFHGRSASSARGTGDGSLTGDAARNLLLCPSCRGCEDQELIRRDVCDRLEEAASKADDTGAFWQKAAEVLLTNVAMAKAGAVPFRDSSRVL